MSNHFRILQQRAISFLLAGAMVGAMFGASTLSAAAQYSSYGTLRHSRHLHPRSFSYRYVTNTVSGSRAGATCPSGYQVISGGANSSLGGYISESYYGSGHDQWIAVEYLPSGGSVTSYAVCAGASSGSYQYVSHTVTGSNPLAGATCPSGYQVIGGGGGTPPASYSSGEFLYDSYYGAGHLEWVAGAGGSSVTAYAVCASSGSSYAYQYVTHTVTSGTLGTISASATCPSGYHVIGGGGYTSPPGDLMESYFGSGHDQWVVEAYPAYGSGGSVTAYAVCT